MQCRDCGTMTFLIEHYVGESMGGDPYVKRTEYYPPLTVRIKPEWHSKLAENYCHLLSEIYQALDNSLLCLAATGTRTLIDRLIVDQIGDIGTFQEKVQQLTEIGIIDEDEKDILIALIDAGSASAHRSYNPSVEAIGHMMDILEKMLFKICVEPKEKQALKEKADALRKETPQKGEQQNQSIDAWRFALQVVHCTNSSFEATV